MNTSEYILGFIQLNKDDHSPMPAAPSTFPDVELRAEMRDGVMFSQEFLAGNQCIYNLAWIKSL